MMITEMTLNPMRSHSTQVPPPIAMLSIFLVKSIVPPNKKAMKRPSKREDSLHG